jgi:hypothetical protein
LTLRKYLNYHHNGRVLLQRFLKKSTKELQDIIDRQELFEPSAINVAFKILNKREKEPQIEAKPSASISHTSSKVSTFSFHPFFRTLSYRDFLTSFALATLLFSIYQIIDLYSNEKLIENNVRLIRVASTIALMISSHIFYRLDHNRSNNFAGRTTHDIIFICFFLTLSKGYSLLIDTGYTFSFEGLGILIGVIILITFFELGISGLRRLLLLLKWRLL